MVHDGRRRDVLDRWANDGAGVDGALRGLEIDMGLFDQLCPVIDRLDEDIDFTGATFAGGADFGRVRFAGRATFNGANFDGDVRFAEVTFGGNARFNGAIFRGPAVFGASAPYYFSGAYHGGPEGATFEAGVEFMGARFNDDALFDRVLFGDYVDFSRARFDAAYRLQNLRSPDEVVEATPTQPIRPISFHDTRFHGGVIADLPAGRVEAAGMEIGAASRLIVRGPVALDRITLDQPLTILTTNRDSVAQLQAAGSAPEIRSLSGATLQAPLIVGNGVSLHRCLLSGAVGLEQLRLHPGAKQLVRHRGRRVIYDEILWRRGDEQLEPGPIAGRYRQLRQGLEEAKNTPGAADFYYGEMEMRRAATANRFEPFFLWLYWLVSGYGLRAWRSIAAYLAVVTTTTTAFRYGAGGLLQDCPPRGSCPDMDDWWSIFVFVVRWSVSLFPSPDTAGISTGGQAVLLALRFVSPVLLALTFLAVRTRVHR